MGPIDSIGFLIIAAIVWSVPFGIVTGILMSNKGRSSCGGFALGFVLGPLGLGIALLMEESLEHRLERIEMDERIRQDARQSWADDVESEAEMRTRIRREEQIRAEERRRAEEELRRERGREDD